MEAIYATAKICDHKKKSVCDLALEPGKSIAKLKSTIEPNC